MSQELEQPFSAMELGELVERGRSLVKSHPPGPHGEAVTAEVGHALLKRGELLLALDLLASADREFPDSVRLRQLMALALARSGATDRARLLLEELHERQGHGGQSAGGADVGSIEETLSLLARVYKDLGLEAQARDVGVAKRHWNRSLELYLNAHTLREGYYPGINAATMALLLGRRERAGRLAAEVREFCLRRLDDVVAGRADEDAYWLNATLGEAAVILGAPDDARRWYSQARDIGLAGRRVSDMASTVRQLHLIAPHMDLDREAVRQLFAMPRVAVFTGHMVDLPTRDSPRLPEAIVPLVKAEIKRWLDREDIQVGFASAACGSDLLFHEALLERGSASHVVLPFGPRDFREYSVNRSGLTWTERFDRVCRRAFVVQLADRPPHVELALEHGDRVLHGLAVIHARQLGTDLRYLAVWNGEAGVTADAIGGWYALAPSIDVIPVPEVRPAVPIQEFARSLAEPPSASVRPSGTAAVTDKAKIVALLFADVVGFSKLNEDQIPIFVQEFLGLVADLLDCIDHPHEKRNTWGDGLYLVFDEVRTAGLFALDLVRRVRETDWEGRGLPKALNLRTGLHAGPVYLCIDPVTRRPNCIGTNVSLTARIEPITPPGEVYASEPFAAIAAAQGLIDFQCRPVGHVPLAKSFGTFPMYHVADARPSAG